MAYLKGPYIASIWEKCQKHKLPRSSIDAPLTNSDNEVAMVTEDALQTELVEHATTSSSMTTGATGLLTDASLVDSAPSSTIQPSILDPQLLMTLSGSAHASIQTPSAVVGISSVLKTSDVNSFVNGASYTFDTSGGASLSTIVNSFVNEASSSVVSNPSHKSKTNFHRPNSPELLQTLQTSTSVKCGSSSDTFNAPDDEASSPTSIINSINTLSDGGHISYDINTLATIDFSDALDDTPINSFPVSSATLNFQTALSNSSVLRKYPVTTCSPVLKTYSANTVIVSTGNVNDGAFTMEQPSTVEYSPSNVVDGAGHNQSQSVQQRFASFSTAYPHQQPPTYNEIGGLITSPFTQVSGVSCSRAQQPQHLHQNSKQQQQYQQQQYQQQQYQQQQYQQQQYQQQQYQQQQYQQQQYQQQQYHQHQQQQQHCKPELFYQHQKSKQ